MVRVKVMLIAAALAIAASVVAAGPAVAAKGGNAIAQACQKGGWTLGTFANQGDCVNDGAHATTVTFNWTGEAQTWTVPDGVTKATFDLYGAEGGLEERKSSGGKGGRATAMIPVTGGSSVQVTVGGQGQSNANPADGGFNGGGSGQLGGGRRRGLGHPHRWNRPREPSARRGWGRRRGQLRCDSGWITNRRG